MCSSDLGISAQLTPCQFSHFTLMKYDTVSLHRTKVLTHFNLALQSDKPRKRVETLRKNNLKKVLT